MLGFSIPKILLLIFIILIVWYGFKMLERKSFSKVQNNKRQKSSKKNAKEGVQETKNDYTEADYTEIDEDNER